MHIHSKSPIIDVFYDARIDALVHLLHSSGARIAEILALNLEDLDTDRRRFQVIGEGNKQRWCFYNNFIHKYE